MWSSQEERDYTFARDIVQAFCPECGEPVGYCYLICPRSPDGYSLEREREDTLYHDSLSRDEWFRLAVNQYEAVHGEPYVS
jgi:hypothetical protein